jgi:hypothetical protein
MQTHLLGGRFPATRETIGNRLLAAYFPQQPFHFSYRKYIWSPEAMDNFRFELSTGFTQW